MQRAQRFAGKTAVVTGGASGIGRATAIRFAEEGARVLVGDVDDEAGQALAAGSDGAIEYRHCDVTRPDDIAALMAAADDAGGLNVVFNNAGAGGTPARIDAIDAADWDHTQALLLRSVALGIRHAAPLLARRGGGAIVNTASVSALGSGYAPVAYSTAKAGVVHLTRMAAAELAAQAIRVNAVVPGFIMTGIFTRYLDVPADRRDAANAAIERAATQAQPVARAGRPEDIAAAVAFLASEEAGFINGVALTIDGGMTIGTRASWDPAAGGGLSAALDAFR